MTDNLRGPPPGSVPISLGVRTSATIGLNTPSRARLFPRRSVTRFPRSTDRIVGVPAGPARAGRRRRAWRRRGRRAQVAAVATILGLLLVVTFIATYLTTTLPNQMQVNDLNHELQVEDELGALTAQLVAATQADAIGAQLSQPVALGSAGAPPFAGQDSGWTSTLPQGSGLAVHYTVLGQLAYLPPVGYPTGGASSSCTVTSTTLTCSTAGYNAHLNYSGNRAVYTISFALSGFAALNLSSNNSTVAYTATGSQNVYYQLIGNNNAVTVTSSSTGVTNLTVIGNSDTVTLGATATGNIVIHLYGNHDTVTFSTHTGTGTVKITEFGVYDQVAFTSVASTPAFAVWFTGFNATSPTSTLCPYANLSSTDAVTSFGSTTATLKETLNNSVAYYANQTVATGWTATYQNVPRTTCPYFAKAQIPVTNGATPGAGFAVHLVNTYAPSAEVAFDQGAIIYAQPGGNPAVFESPQMVVKVLNTTKGSSSWTNVTGVLFWIPEFVGTVPGESGVSTADLSFQLLGVQPVLVSNVTGLVTSAATPVTVTVTTPYAAAWLAFVNAHNWPFKASCTPVPPATSAVCNGPYTDYVGLGTVTFAIPTTSLITLGISVASFSVSII